VVTHFAGPAWLLPVAIPRGDFSEGKDPENVSRWHVALAAVEQAEAGADATAHERLLVLRTEIEAGLAGARPPTCLSSVLAHQYSARPAHGGPHLS
jgi:hypothetical protein